MRALLLLLVLLGLSKAIDIYQLESFLGASDVSKRLFAETHELQSADPYKVVDTLKNIVQFSLKWCAIVDNAVIEYTQEKDLTKARVHFGDSFHDLVIGYYSFDDHHPISSALHKLVDEVILIQLNVEEILRRTDGMLAQSGDSISDILVVATAVKNLVKNALVIWGDTVSTLSEIGFCSEMTLECLKTDSIIVLTRASQTLHAIDEDHMVRLFNFLPARYENLKNATIVFYPTLKLLVDGLLKAVVGLEIPNFSPVNGHSLDQFFDFKSVWSAVTMVLDILVPKVAQVMDEILKHVRYFFSATTALFSRLPGGITFITTLIKGFLAIAPYIPFVGQYFSLFHIDAAIDCVVQTEVILEYGPTATFGVEILWNGTASAVSSLSNLTKAVGQAETNGRQVMFYIAERRESASDVSRLVVSILSVLLPAILC